ncbi:MAG: mechanosensitive ion channel [Deltaproteobacteria bacterium]|nr:mechanosensitive ion channel [Deltaproteobacteria bacterium]
MDIGSALVAEARESWTPWIVLTAVVSVLVVDRHRDHGRRSVRTTLVLVVVHLLLLVAAGAVRAYSGSPHRDLRLTCVLTGALCAVIAVGGFVFQGVLPRLHVRSPRILQDVAVVVVGSVTALVVASRAGLDLSSIVATSAVLTAVIGLSLQDTLGNIVGGVALQTDDSLNVGDWVRVGDVSGRIVDMRWRYTAIETRNWETVVIPNSTLVKTQVVVLGRRQGKPLQWRRWVWFNVDYRFPPSDVIEAVDRGLQKAAIPNVALEPAAHAILMDFADSWGRYAVRYWLTDIALDDPTDSAVRQRIYFALKRAGIALSIPAHAVFVTEESRERVAEKMREDADRRLAAITSLPLFKDLAEEERVALASSLRYAPFARGEALTVQGAKAHWLYIVTRGECAVRIRVGDDEREVARIGAGQFFGEMSLLTGAERSATVVATTDVECWRLDRSAFSALLAQRPHLADVVAGELARRQDELEDVKEHLGAEARARRMASQKQHFASRIRAFFGLETAPTEE